MEVPKRLDPQKDVLRELFLKSGNECAFPGCTHKMIESDGTFVGEICHIEAALTGGERFNPSMSNEDRRQFDNLMLMCHRHHKITDNIDEYSVARMKEIKASHEAKFTDIATTILNSFSDHTEYSKIGYANTLLRINEVLDWEISADDLLVNAEELKSFSDRIKSLPIPTRQLLVIMIKRAKYESGVGFSITSHEVEQVTGADKRELSEHISILYKYEVIRDGGTNDFDLPMIQFKDLPGSGWPIIQDIKTFCEKTSITLDEILVDLKFTLLD